MTLRKGQYFYNALRLFDDNKTFRTEDQICTLIFNMTNEEFDKIMDKYEEKKNG